MNRANLQQLVDERVRDALALLDARRWSAAYYLAGYAAECALKSCVLAYLDATGMLFLDRKYLKNLGDCWTHDLVLLKKLAGLDDDFGRACIQSPALGANWGVLMDRSETSRYEVKSEEDARRLIEAITQEPDGVPAWLRTRW